VKGRTYTEPLHGKMLVWIIKGAIKRLDK